MNAQEITGQQARWAVFLSKFNFDILHLPGRTNPGDPASRRSDYSGKKDLTNKFILLGNQEEVNIGAITIIQLNIKRIHNPSSMFILADEKTMHMIKILYETDDFFIRGNTHSARLFNRNRDSRYVPKSLCNIILQHIHDSPTEGHWGIMRTILDLLYGTFG